MSGSARTGWHHDYGVRATCGEYLSRVGHERRQPALTVQARATRALAAAPVVTPPWDPRLAVQVEDDRKPAVRQFKEDAA